MKDSLHCMVDSLSESQNTTVVYLRPASSCCRLHLRLPNICFYVYDL